MKRRDLLRTSAAALLASGATGLVPLRIAAAPGGTQVTAAQRFRVGEATVTALSDGFFPFTADVFTGIDAATFNNLVAAGHQDPASLRGAVNAYMIESGGETWMIDAGTGPVFGPTLGHMPEVFAALGVDTGAVSKLIVTHLHADHIGGALTDGAPTFPNAELIVSAADRAFWTDDTIRAQAPADFQGMFDLAKAVLAAYGDRLRLIEGEADVAPGITARPMPGHTVGHTGFMLESDADSLLIWGDIIHVPAVQLIRPEVTLLFDTDQDLAAKTRGDLMTSLAGSGQLIAGMHMLFPGLGYLDRIGDRYHFTPAPWQYL